MGDPNNQGSGLAPVANYAFAKVQYAQYVHGQAIDDVVEIMQEAFAGTPSDGDNSHLYGLPIEDEGPGGWFVGSSNMAGDSIQVRDGQYVTLTSPYSLNALGIFNEQEFNDRFTTNVGSGSGSGSGGSVTISFGTISVPLSDYITIQVPIGDVTGTIGASDPLPTL